MPDQKIVITPEELARLRSVKDVGRFSTLRTIAALILREMSASYGRSIGGYAWVILEPVLGIGLLVAVFSVGFKSPPLGTNFALFYATGMMPLFMFTTTAAKVSQAMNYSRQLLNYPRVTFLDAILARFLLNMITQCVITFILIGGILLMSETRSTFHLTKIVSSLTMGASLGLGVGILLCTLISQHPIWQTVWSVLTRPLILVSGVIILTETIPDPYRSWLHWNPIVHIVTEMRRAFYYSYRAEYLDTSFVYMVSLACGVIGLFFLRRYYRNMIEK